MGEIESVHIFAIATLLDPRFRTLELNHFERSSRALNLVKDMLNAEINSQRKSVSLAKSNEDTQRKANLNKFIIRLIFS